MQRDRTGTWEISYLAAVVACRVCTAVRIGKARSYEDKKYENANRTKAELIAEILRDYERSGDAMRYLNAAAQIAWKASPAMLRKLADAEREVEDDMEGLP